MLVLPFAVALFLSASLLFAVQPLIGRLLLPYLGGSPAVWNTCMVFFQAVLLLGYLYAHATRRLELRTRIVVHVGLLFLPLLFLPIGFAAGIDPDVRNPIVWLLATLVTGVGVPFFVVSTHSPLLQSWYASAGRASSRDPYFLFAASNAGSFAALISYPVMIEPQLTLGQQGEWWLWGYVGLMAVVALCGVATWFGNRHAVSDAEPAPPPSVEPDANSRPLMWMLLGFIPSSLLVGVTTYLTTDVAPIPLLWVIPLGLYLISFILGFSATIATPLKFLGRFAAILVVAQSFAMLVRATEPIWILLPLHMLTFFVACWLCHGWVARLRPPAVDLTRFFLWLSFGGVLGGAFNTLLAPILFHRLGGVEYPLLLVALALIRPSAARPYGRGDLLWPVVIFACVLVAVTLVDGNRTVGGWFATAAETTGLKAFQIRDAALFGLPLIAVYCFIDHPLRFALGLGGLFIAGSMLPGPWGTTIHLERNSLGTLRVTQDADGKYHRMVHGNTIHGIQRLGSNEPLSFYHPSGPAGHVFRRIVAGWGGDVHVGVVGLGTGSLASFAEPNQDWTFFELDPAIARLAADENYFTFLRDSKAGGLRVTLGDARLQLTKEQDRSFDIIVLDAFSSDAIPMHLLTAQALSLYLQKLKPHGLLLFHVSNRSLSLTPILAKLGKESSPPSRAFYCEDRFLTEDERLLEKSPSVWVVMTTMPNRYEIPIRQCFFSVAVFGSDTPLWTDDRVNIWPIWNWNRDDE